MHAEQLHEGIGRSLSQRPVDPLAEQRRLDAARRLGSLAAAARHAAEDLGGDFPRAARHFDNTAAGFEHLSNVLRDPHLDDVMAMAANLGRYQPAAIVAGVMLIGLGLSWLLVGAGNRADIEAGDFGTN